MSRSKTEFYLFTYPCIIFRRNRKGSERTFRIGLVPQVIQVNDKRYDNVRSRNSLRDDVVFFLRDNRFKVIVKEVKGI